MTFLRPIALIFLALFIPLSGSGQDSKKDYSEAITLIEVWLEAQKDYENLPGISLSVVDDQEILWSGAFGSANPKEQVASKTSTIYSICSISKLFTSIAIMQLVETGKLRLDDQVAELLPWYDLEQQFEDSWPITVRSLLTHSSGLPREANFPYWTGPDFPFPTQEAIRNELKNQETLYPGSTYFQYSNLGLTLLGEIVEEVSGLAFSDYIQKHIFDVLGLDNTRTLLPEELYGTDLAIGHTALNREMMRDEVDLFQARGIASAAGFSSNVVDLGKFASWQFRLLDTTVAEVIKPSTLKHMHNVHWTDPDWGTTWGLGFSVRKGSDGKKWVSHGGSCPGYRSTFTIQPESKRAYSVMINASGSNPGKYAMGVHGILAKVPAGKSDEEKESEPGPDFTAYTGLYDLMPWGSELYVAQWYGKIAMMYLPSDSPADAMNLYKHIEGDTFRRIRENDELGETVVFQRDDQGKVTHFTSHGNHTRKKR